MDESQTIRVSVEEAAVLLGIEQGSVKKRIQRGKLRSEKDARGITWVYLDRSETVRDQSQGRSETDRDELVGELRDRIAYLERQVGEERESRRRADTIIAQLTQANAALAARVPELEAPGTPETAAEASEGAESRLAAGEDQATTQHHQVQRLTEGVEHDAGTLREWTGDVEETAAGPMRGRRRRAHRGPGGAGCLEASVWETLAGGLIAIAAGLVGFGGSYWTQTQQWRREDEHRDYAERRQAYTEFLASWHSFEEVRTRQQPSTSQPLAAFEELQKAELQFQRSFNVLSLIAPVEVTEAAASVRDREPGAPGRFWKAARKDLGKWPSQGRA